MRRIWCVPNNASKGQMVFNLAFKGSNVLATFIAYLKHIILNIFNCSMRTDGRTNEKARMTLLTVAFRNFENAPTSTFTRTTILFSTYVQASLFRLCPVDAWYRHRSPIATFSCARPLLKATKTHLCHKDPAMSHRIHAIWTHCWSSTIRRRNICADRRVLQYCTVPCRNIRRRWTANCYDM